MKWMPAWRWENRWLLFALSGLLVLPWTINLATVPNVTRVYLGAWPFTLIKVFLFGLLWGVGSTLFGLAINRVGMVLGFALILGITSSFGSLIPMTILHPEQLLAKRGLALIAGTAVMVLGLVFLTLAGRIREHDAKTGGGVRSGFAVGLVHCIFSGIFSSMMNFSFVFGDELKRTEASCSPGRSARHDGGECDLGTHSNRRLCREFPVLRVSAAQEPDMVGIL